MAQTKVKLISDGVIVQSNLHSSHGITTAHIGEGSNLYYTDARVDTRVGNLNTGNLPEGSNLYYTDARADARIAAASTSDLSEGTNLYYTDARADARVALIVDSSPSTLNTLNELAAALGDDPNFATTTATSIGLKAPLASPSFTGNATFAGPIYLINTSARISAGGSGEVGFNYNTGATGSLVWYGGGTASKFNVTSAGNATFAGKITAPTLSIQNQINTTSSNLEINYANGDGTTTNFKDFYVRDGKNGVILNIQGSSKNSTFAGTVTGTIARFDTLNNNANSANIIYRSGTDTIVGGGSPPNKIYIQDSGNVGIGTTTPGSILTVRKDAAGGRGGEISIVNYAANTVGNEAALNFGLESSTYHGDLGNAQIKARVNASNAASDMIFSTWNGTSFGERMRIESDGKIQVGSDKVIWAGGYGGGLVIRRNNATGDRLIKMVTVDSTGAIASDNVLVAKGTYVGINTESPEQRLHVVGKMKITDDIIFAQTNGRMDYDNGVSSGALRFFSTSGNTERMRITSAGRVGIGTTNPQAALDISSSYSIQGNVRTYMYAGTAAGFTNINLDITVGNEGGQGNVFKIEAGFAHYYAMTYNSIAEWWCTSRGATVINTYILNAGTSFAGTWSASKPSTTVLRITKSAGTYSGSGKYWVKVTYVPF